MIKSFRNILAIRYNLVIFIELFTFIFSWLEVWVSVSIINTDFTDYSNNTADRDWYLLKQLYTEPFALYNNAISTLLYT